MKYKTCTDYWLDKENFSLKGEFEEMYQDIEDPWGCGEFSNSINNKVFCELVFHNRKFSRILDIGSGLGELTNKLYQFNKGGEVTGWEISQTATTKATKNYPHISFENKNILVDNCIVRYQLISMSEVLWYLLEDLEGVFKKLYESLEDNGLLAIHQYFPHQQNFGIEKINGLEGFEEFIERKTDFEIEKKIVSYDNEDKVLLALLKKIG